MASVATLGFSIISRYSGGGMAAARRDVMATRAAITAFNDDMDRHTKLLSGIPQRWKAIGVAVAGIAPAMLPIAGVVAQTTGAFTVMAASVGAALGIYGAAVKGAITRTMEMAKAGKALSPVQKEFVGAVNGMKGAWNQFIKDTQGQTLKTATNVVQGLTNGIKLLKPIVDAIHPSLLQVSKDFEAWFKGDSAKQYSGIIAGIAKTSMPLLLQAGKDTLNVLGDGFRALAPLANDVARAIAAGAANLRQWSDGGGFQRFLTYVRENEGPVGRFFQAFGAALKNIFQILAQFSAGSLGVLTDFFRMIAALNPESVKAMANAFLLLRSPLLWLVLNCPPLRDAMIALLGAMNPQTIYAIAAAFVVWRTAMLLVNATIISTPVGWIITALAALAVAIVFIATKTTWFQTAWQYTWNFVKTVAETIWNGLVVAWNAFIMAMQTAWTAVSTALVTAWNFVWQGMATAAQAVWTGLQIAWAAFTNALAVAWTTVSTALVTAWNFVWTGMQTAAQAVWTALQIAWSAFVGALATAWTTVSTALVTAWNFVWTGMQTAAQAVWTALQIAWTAFVTALSTAWTTVSTALVAAWNFVWTGMQTAAQAVWTALQIAWSAFITALSTTWTAVSTALSAAWSAVWNAMSTAARAIWTALQAAWSAFISAMQTIWTTVSSALSASWNAVWNAMRAAGEAVWNAMKAAWQAMTSFFSSVWASFSSAMSSAWNAFWTAIRTVAETIWHQLQSWWQQFVNLLTNVWNTFANAFKVSWQTVWTWIRTTAETIWHQLQDWWQQFVNLIRNVWNTFSTAFKESWQAVWTWIRTTAETIWHQMQDWWQQFVNLIRNVWDKFASAFKEAWQSTWDTVKSIANKVWHEIGEIIEKAINAVIGLINGLIKGFNAITSFLHIDVKVDTIDKVNFNFAEGGMVGLTPYMVGGMAEFATGGVANLKRGGTLSGYAPGRDTVPAVLSRGEGVLTPEAVRGMGGPGFVHAANRQFAGHRGAGRQAKAPLSKYTGSHDIMPNSTKRHRFAKGGIVGGVQHFAVGGMTAAALAKAGVSLGMISQGEYSNGSLSAGTHMGGGVVDIASGDPGLVAKLRAAGFAAWLRTPAQGFSTHIHAVLMNHPDLSGPAAAQVKDYLAGGDGLGAGGGGGGGGIDILGLLGDNVGKILHNVYRGLKPLADIGGALADLFGFGDDKDDGGLFGTGIGPDVGPNVADAVGDVVGAVTGADSIGGEMMKMLGQMVLSVMEKGDIAEGLSDATGKLKDVGGIGGAMGKIAAGFAKKLIDEVMPDFLLEEKEKAGPLDMSLFAGIAGGGGTAQWSGLAAMAMKLGGLDVSQLPKFLALMAAESGGNPLAINTTDINAKNGIPSQGLMQIIPPNFTKYHVPGTSNNILDPLANMAAAAAYIRDVYGGRVPGSPYALGTSGATSGVHLVGEQGPELVNFSGGQTVTPAKETAQILAGGGMGSTNPEDLMAQFQMLMQLAQQMAMQVQTSWGAVTTSGTSAKSAMAPIFTDLATQMGTNVPTAMAAMATANTTAWTAMQTGTTTQWTAMRDTTFAEANDHMTVKMPTWGTEMGAAVGQAWTNMGDATSTAWEGMKEGTREPTNWIIDQSYNNGIRALWNQVAGVIFDDGAKELPSVATLAKGGPVHGPGGERADRVPAMLSRGEHVWTAREVHRAGGHHAVQQMRAGVMGRGVRGAHDGCGFALGGWLGGGVSGSSPSVPELDLKRGSMMDTVGDHLDQIDAAARSALAGSMYRQMGAVSDVLSPTDWIRQYVKKDDELNKIGSGGPPWIDGVSDVHVSYDGWTVNARTRDMLDMAKSIGASFSLFQGSFNTGVAASAGTHDGGGVVDLGPASASNVGALRAVGFAAWGRGPEWGSPVFGSHIHAVALGDPTVSPGAASQIQSYLAGGNGLADGGPDNYSGGIPSVDGVAAIGGGRNVDPADLEQNVMSFDQGGLLPTGLSLVHNGTGKPEPVGHDLVPRNSGGDVHLSMPITVQGNLDEKAVAKLDSEVLPKLRVLLAKGTGK